jgi:hypothetical protein
VLASWVVPTRPPTRNEIERHISDLAETYGWRHHHTRCSGLTREGYADGFPSDVLIRDGRLAFIAITDSKALLTPPEARWAHDLSRAPSVELHVVERRALKALTRALTLQTGEATSATDVASENHAPCHQPGNSRDAIVPTR